jgi:hypothetical protein
MPFGKKPAPSGAQVDFDAVYRDLIAPAIAEAGLEPLRADEEVTGGIIHKPMFERLIRKARERRGEVLPWAKEIEGALEQRAKA